MEKSCGVVCLPPLLRCAALASRHYHGRIRAIDNPLDNGIGATKMPRSLTNMT